MQVSNFLSNFDGGARNNLFEVELSGNFAGTTGTTLSVAGGLELSGATGVILSIIGGTTFSILTSAHESFKMQK